VKFSVCPSIFLNSREYLPLGVNEGVNIPRRGQSSPLGANFNPGRKPCCLKLASVFTALPYPFFSRSATPLTSKFIDTTTIPAKPGEGCPRCGGSVFHAEQMFSKGKTYHKVRSLANCFLTMYCPIRWPDAISRPRSSKANTILTYHIRRKGMLANIKNNHSTYVGIL
jgi:hypothetical protein